MASEDEIERLRLAADTILTRYQSVERALERARHEDGDHWEDGELELTLETPQGDSIDVTLDLDASPDQSAQRRYDRAAELEAALERKQAVVDKVAVLPPDPVAYLVCYHLDTVEGNYPRSMAGLLDADRDHVEDCCADLLDAGVLERVESGTVKQRRVKAKQADEVRQHHTYYRLSRQGDHLLRFLANREGKRNVLLHLPDGLRTAEYLSEMGPATPRDVAADRNKSFETTRAYCRALHWVGLLRTGDGSDGTSVYATTDEAETLLEGIDY